MWFRIHPIKDCIRILVFYQGKAEEFISASQQVCQPTVSRVEKGHPAGIIELGTGPKERKDCYIKSQKLVTGEDKVFVYLARTNDSLLFISKSPNE